MKSRSVEISRSQEYLVLKAVRDFFTPHEQWGRLNKRQFITGVICTFVYFIVNTIYSPSHREFDTFAFSSSGLVVSIYICWSILIAEFTRAIFAISSSGTPWFERYMPVIITMLGISTLTAIQNLANIGMQDAAMWINIVILFIIFIITAGFFVESSSNERIIKRWFALLGYYFSIVVFFYFCETIIFGM
jgi:hypothetical protein